MKREQWRFVGRKTYYGYDYWVWELTAHPRGTHRVGKLSAVKAP